MSTSHEASRQRRVSFRITTTSALPVGEQVFVTGSAEALGRWKPDALPLTRMDDNVWSGAAEIPAAEPLEFKFTRGTWPREEVTGGGQVPANYALPPGRDPAEVTHRVYRWKDEPEAAAPRITGNYRVHEAVHSQFLRFDRRVVVWLPPDYEFEKERRYPVVYLQDGQQVFDPQTSSSNQDWQVDEWCEKMIVEERIEPLIAVGVYSTEDSFLEYHPSLAGPDYARFLIEELKPMIDREYRTRPGRDATAVAGSSLGATIAFYLAWTRPDAFHAVACLSPAFRLRQDELVLDLVRREKNRRDLACYLYCGLGDKLEKELMQGTVEMFNLLKARGWQPGRDLLFEQDAGGQHHEAAWSRHTPAWLQFLFPRAAS